jgi:3-dehydroquinate synthetase
MARACELGVAIGITPRDRAQKIMKILTAFGYEIRSPHPLVKNSSDFMKALGGDKKKRGGKLVFVVPAAEQAVLISSDRIEPELPERIINGEYFNEI